MVDGNLTGDWIAVATFVVVIAAVVISEIQKREKNVTNLLNLSQKLRHFSYLVTTK